MKPEQKKLRVRLVKKEITVEQFYDKHIKPLKDGVTLAVFRNMYYGSSKMNDSVSNAIQGFMEEK